MFVGPGIFKSSDPAKRATAIVQATTEGESEVRGELTFSPQWRTAFEMADVILGVDVQSHRSQIATVCAKCRCVGFTPRHQRTWNRLLRQDEHAT